MTTVLKIKKIRMPEYNGKRRTRKCRWDLRLKSLCGTARRGTTSKIGVKILRIKSH